MTENTIYPISFLYTHREYAPFFSDPDQIKYDIIEYILNIYATKFDGREIEFLIGEPDINQIFRFVKKVNFVIYIFIKNPKYTKPMEASRFPHESWKDHKVIQIQNQIVGAMRTA